MPNQHSYHKTIVIKASVSQFAEYHNFKQHSYHSKKQTVYSTSPSVIVENAPLNFVKEGYYNYADGQLYTRGTSGYRWSTTANDSTTVYDFGFGSTHFGPQDGSYKGQGFSVRRITCP